LDLLDATVAQEMGQADIRRRIRVIEETLASFNIQARVVEVNQGPTVTQFGVQPAPGITVNRIVARQNDLALALGAYPLRIEAPVPGKTVVGIEVPNTATALVGLRGIIETAAFQKLKARSKLAIALGQDVSGQAVAADLAKMPHLLIAGATGSGKSVCINSIIACLLFHTTPDEVRFIMVDPKMVELTNFNGIPHLVTPVVTEADKVVNVLKHALQEMNRRYHIFRESGARNIETYNRVASSRGRSRLPYMIIIIDELADMMMLAPEEVEKGICRIAQMARATGIHLVIATQRPSVDVITGLIKANIPARISFAVTSQVDSRVILDAIGAEKLLGRGDMLYMAADSSKTTRLQGAFVSDRELEAVVSFWKGQRLPQAQEALEAGTWTEPVEEESEDALLEQAVKLVQESGRVSTSYLQRKLHIGYNRAATLMDLLVDRGIVEVAAEGGRREVRLKQDEAAETDS
jgi:S-DNA-T family DNA segregation ATPase FtsK/SpoIIIE